jgi:hypothetical protein
VLIEVINHEVEAETATKKAAQPGIAQRYREHNNDQQRLHVCACCGERNKEATGKYAERAVLQAGVSEQGEAQKLTADRGPRAAAVYTQ